MKFKLDENLPTAAATALRERGHDALMVLDQISAGGTDEKVTTLIVGEGRALLTLDLDFADIRTYRPSEYPGIAVLRPRRGDASTVLALVARVATAVETETLPGFLWIVEEERIRIRGD